MSGHHHHHHVDPEAGDGRVALAVGINLLLTVAQIVGGILSGSLALIADAIHNLSDAMSLVIAFVARKIARRPADAQMTFGYARAEIVAALVNYTSLILIGLYLAFEAVLRFFEPEPVTGWLVIAVAGVALAVDLATAALTFALSKESVNIRAAFLHNVADALGSVAVIVAGVVILVFGWVWVDPAITLLIAGYILWMSFSEIGEVIRLLMLAAPRDLDSELVLRALRDLPGVADVHHAHLWRIDENRTSFEGHLVVAETRWSEADAIKARAKSVLSERFGIGHATLELECARHACDAPETFGAAATAGSGHSH